MQTECAEDRTESNYQTEESNRSLTLQQTEPERKESQHPGERHTKKKDSLFDKVHKRGD